MSLIQVTNTTDYNIFSFRQISQKNPPKLYFDPVSCLVPKGTHRSKNQPLSKKKENGKSNVEKKIVQQQPPPPYLVKRYAISNSNAKARCHTHYLCNTCFFGLSSYNHWRISNYIASITDNY